jgi:ribosomal protein L44E
MSVKQIEETYMEYVCDVCGHKCWFETWRTPKGWGTSRDDHDNTFCPDCNPWLQHNQEPDSEKLKRVEEAYVKSHNGGGVSRLG